MAATSESVRALPCGAHIEEASSYRSAACQLPRTPSAAVVALTATRDRLVTALIGGADSPGPAIASPADVVAAAAKCRHELKQLGREHADLEQANRGIADEIQRLKLPSIVGLAPQEFVVAVDAALARVLTGDSVERTGLDDELATGYHDALTEQCWDRVTAHLEQLSDDNIIMVIATASGVDKIVRI